MGKPPSVQDEGKKLVELRSYVEAEGNAWNMYATGGDEDVVNAGTPDNSTKFFLDAVAASASNGFTKLSTHNHDHVEKVAGNFFNFKITATSPDRMKYRGISGAYSPGDTTRPPNT